jgi:CRISPR-associated endonuclease Csy4
MNHFVDIEILENPDIQPATLLNSLFGKFHKALVQADDGLQIGISFPKCKSVGFPTLGNVLRLHGEEEKLLLFIAMNWYSTLIDYLSVSKVQTIPKEVNFAHIKRIQIQSNAERLRRRFMKRHGVNAETAKLKIPDSVAQITKLPWLQVRSASTAQGFRLFIEIGKVSKTAVSGSFNRYGLSATATVPIF